MMSASLDHCEGQLRYNRQTAHKAQSLAHCRGAKCGCWVLRGHLCLICSTSSIGVKFPIREEAFMLAGGCNQGGSVLPWCLSWTEWCKWVPFACGTY